MKKTNKPNGYWTKERCQEVALKCKTRTEFQNKFSSAYNKAWKNKWVDEICSHMSFVRYAGHHWTKERCQEVALKCKTKKEFREKFNGAYIKAGRQGWKDEICSHMKVLGDRKHKLIYGYFFEDNHVYIGLTYNIDDRNHSHLNNENSAVYKHIKICPKYELKILTELLPVKLAQQEERRFIKFYEKKGFSMLNIEPGGNTGGSILKWTKERCQEVALKCETKGEFHEKFSGAYNSSKKNGWFDEICSHMKSIYNKKNYWTKEKCHEMALKCDNRKDFQEEYSVAYQKSLRNGWLDDVCSHMKRQIKPNGHWTKERCQEKALKCKTKTEFKKRFGGAYYSAFKNKWIDEICSHMKIIYKGRGYWTKERCREVALSCKSKSEFRTSHSVAYVISRNNGWLDEFFPK